MLQGSISISASVDEYDDDGMCTFFVTVQKGALEVRARFFGNVDSWKGFGQALLEFPKTPTDYVFFHSGTDSVYDEKLFLKAYAYGSPTHTALSITIDHQTEPPNDFRIQFSISAEAASLNRLGRLLVNWEVNNTSKIYWQALTS